MTDEQLIIIEARAGVLKAAMPYPSMWTLDTTAIDFIRNDVPALVAEVRRQREMLNEFYLACISFDKVIPVYGMTNTERIRAAAVEITRLRADVERIGHERDQMVAANVELQQRLSTTIEVLEFGEFVVLNAQQYLPGATGIERDANKFMNQCNALLHSKEVKHDPTRQ